MLWCITLSSFGLIQQYWAQSWENSMSCNFPIVKSGQNWDKCQRKMLPYGSQTLISNTSFKHILYEVSCCNNSSYWSDKIYIIISVGAKNLKCLFLTCASIRLFLQELCHFAETLLYHLAFSAMLHTISHFYKWARSFYSPCLSVERPWIYGWLVSAAAMMVGGAQWAAVLKPNRGSILAGTEWNSQQQCFREAVEL